MEKTSNGGEPGVAVGQAPPTATTPTPDGRGVQSNSEVLSGQQQHLDRQLADQNAKLRKFVEEESGNLQRELAKRIDELEAQVREARKAQDASRKDQREATNVAEDAKSATQSAVTKLGEHDGQLAALRAAVEALNNGETVGRTSSPPPPPTPQRKSCAARAHAINECKMADQTANRCSPKPQSCVVA